MTGVITFIKQKFSNEGVSQTVRGTQRIGRAQTNLAGGAKAAGREFGAQAQGLGGLVAAYAGAAATIFALQQAFSSLNRAAVAEQTIQGTRALGAAIGESGDIILANVQNITKDMLTLVEAAENVNIALSAGFNTKQIRELSEVSLRASKALGRSLTDAFNRLVRGTAKLEPELLDELGIFVRIEPAVERYAAQIGKASTQLTNFERRQAFVNATIEEGQRKFSTIDTSSSTAAEALQQLAAAVLDTARVVGVFIANVVKPIVEFIGSSGLNIVAISAALALTILGKALGLASGALANLGEKRLVSATKSMKDFLETTEKGQKAVNAFTKSVKGLNKTVIKGPTAAQTKELIGLAEAQKLSGAQARQLATNLGIQATAAKNAATQAEAEAAALDKVTDRTKKQNVALKAAQTRTINQTKEAVKFEKSQRTINTALKNVNPTLLAQEERAVKVAAKINRLTGTVSRIVGFITTWALAIGFVVIAFNALISALDLTREFSNLVKDIGRSISGFFGFTAAAKEAKEGMIGLAEGIVGFRLGEVFKDIPKELPIVKSFAGLFDIETTRNLKDFQDAIRELSDPNRKVIRILSDDQVKNFKETGVEVKRINTGIDVGKFKIPASAISATERLSEGLEILRKNFNFTTAAGIKVGLALEKSLVDALAVADAAGQFATVSTELGIPIAELGRKLIATTETVDGLKIAFLSLKDAGQEFGEGIQFGVKSSVELTKRARKLAIDLNKQGFNTGRNFDKAAPGTKIEVAGTKVTARTSTGNLKTVLELQKEINALLQDENSIRIKLAGALVKGSDLQKELNAGAVSADGISRGLLALDNLLNFATEERIKLFSDLEKEAVKQLRIDRDILAIQAQTQIAITQQVTDLRRVFSAQISAAGNLLGLVDDNFKIADSQLEVKTNELIVLEDTLEKTAGVVKLNKDIALETSFRTKLLGEEPKLLELGITARKILLGLFINTRKEVKKLNDELTKRTAKVLASIELSNLQTSLKITQQLLAIEQARNNNRKKQIADSIKLLELQKQQLELVLKRIETEQKGRTALAQGIITGPAEGLFTDAARGKLEIFIAEQDLDRFEAGVKLQIISATEQTALRKKGIQDEIASEKRQLKLGKELVDKQTLIEVSRAQGQAAQLRLEAKLLIERSDFIVRQASIFDKFIADLTLALAANRVGIAKATPGGIAAAFPELADQIKGFRTFSPEKQAQLAIDSISDTIGKKVEETNARLGASAKALGLKAGLAAEDILALADTLEDNAGATGELKKQLLDIKSTGAVTGLTNQLSILDLQLKLTKERLADEIRQRRINLATLKRIAELERNELLKAAVGIVEAVNSTISTAIEAIRTSFLEDGRIDFAEGAKEIARIFVDNITKTITETLIIQPIQELVTEGLGGFFADILGVTTEENKPKGTDGDPIFVATSSRERLASSVQGALGGQSGIASSLANLLGGFGAGGATSGFDAGGFISAGDQFGPGGSLTTSFSTFSEGIFGTGGTLENGLSSIFGEQGFFSGLLDGIGSILSEVFGSILGGAGGGAGGSAIASIAASAATSFASGGSVRRFAPGGSALRDNVLARLEPGEFVVRKQAVRNIGVSALQNINRGGSGGGGGNVQVNITNNGTAQETEDKPKIKFDPEKMIIDIILKDIKSNGPVRQGIKGIRG